MSSARKMAAGGGGEKKKKSKLDKIYELQADKKELKEENKSLRKQLEELKQQGASPTAVSPRHKKASIGDEAKLMEAMKALKRVTVKQEKSLHTLRAKAEERRKQITEKDEKIASLKQGLNEQKRQQKTRKSTGDDDVDALRAKVEDLQVSCSEQESENRQLTAALQESEEKAKNLQKQLDSARSLLQGGAPSARSIRSETSMSEMDVARMRKELANKIERIVLLEFDLEMCKDELHELRQARVTSESAFRSPDEQNFNGEVEFEEDSFYSDEDDDDEDDEWR